MKLYITLTTSVVDDTVNNNMSVFLAQSKSEALGFAVAAAKDLWPSGDIAGNILVNQIPDDIIRMAYQVNQIPDDIIRRAYHELDDKVES